MLTYLRGVDKQRITRVYGRITDETMRRVEEAIRVVTGLTKI
jgi:mRNA-degrading endonuclease toxin of MazEF toxin-antitoxin module